MSGTKQNSNHVRDLAENMAAAKQARGQASVVQHAETDMRHTIVAPRAYSGFLTSFWFYFGGAAHCKRLRCARAVSGWKILTDYRQANYMEKCVRYQSAECGLDAQKKSMVGATEQSLMLVAAQSCLT